MKVPLQVVFKEIDRSDAVIIKIQEQVDKLEHIYQGIMSCRVVVAVPHRHHRLGNLFQVKVILKVPGGKLVVQRNPTQAGQHKDVYVAVRDAFLGARRELEHYVRKRRRQVKELDSSPHGQVIQIVRESSNEGYGFIRTQEGRELYFHKQSVLDHHFDQLAVGTEVRFSEEMGEEGPQASTVEIVHPRIHSNRIRQKVA